MKSEQIQQEEVGDTPDFREARCDEIGVEVPLFEMIESGDEAVRDEKHEPEDEAVEAATAAPESFVLVVRENHGQGHDENQRGEADIRLRKLRPEVAPLQILFQLYGEGAAITPFIRKKIEHAQHQEEDAVDEGRNPVELEAKVEDIEIFIMSCDREYTEIKENVNRHQRAGDLTKALVEAGAFWACCDLQSDCVLFSCCSFYFLYCFYCVSGFLLLAHGEAPLSN